MRFIKILSLLLSLLMVAFCFTGCQESYKEAFIYVEFEARPQTLDPQLASSTEELTVARSLFDTLLRYDASGKLIPSAAESYEQKGNTYTFKLRQDAKWTDGTAVTAHDFVFAFRRAVDPKTSAPYGNMLWAVKNAEKILKGNAATSTLGISATDNYTLVIKLERDDPEFLKVLTSAVTMPCNEAFFENCMGKYGLTVETTPSNGSYYVRKWTTEDKFLIRLAKNLDYTGPFEANSMRIYYTCSDRDSLQMMEQESTDLAYSSTEEFDSFVDSDFETVSNQNVFYGLFLSPSLDPDIRKALLCSIESGQISSAIGGNQATATSLYPDVLGLSSTPQVSSYIKYNPSEAQSIYSAKVKEGFQLNDIAIFAPNDPSGKAVAKNLAGHWQQTLSCFINIEEKSSSEIRYAFAYGSYDIIIAPIFSSANTVSSFHSELGFETSEPDEVCKNLFGENLCYPLFFSSSGISAVDSVENLEECIQNGILDVSMLIKQP